MLKNKRQKLIYQALVDLGGVADTRRIAERCGLNTNGVSQTLGVMDDVGFSYDSRTRITMWRLIDSDN